MISLAEAKQFVLSGCHVTGVEWRGIDEALGYVVVDTIVSDQSVPSFDNSAVDGYALRSVDVGNLPVLLHEVDAVMAGYASQRKLGQGEAIRIMTGAPIPIGADAVCMIEDVEIVVSAGAGGAGESGGAGSAIETTLASGRKQIKIGCQSKPGANIRRIGEDIAVGQELISGGSVLSCSHIGVLASVGIDRVKVYSQPRVGVMSTGDELIALPNPLRPGGIRDSNRHLLLALVRKAGFEAIDLGVVGDDEGRVAAALTAATERCDAIVTSGGVSVGDRDVIKAVLKDLSNGSMRWMQVAIKPAKPLAFGVISDRQIPVFGLPGNPVSAFVSFELFAAPALRMMSGHSVIDRPMVSATASEEFSRRKDGKVHFQRAIATWSKDATLCAVPVLGQQSHQLSAMADANALAILPDGHGVCVGSRVEVMLLDAPQDGGGAGGPLGGWPK